MHECGRRRRTCRHWRGPPPNENSPQGIVFLPLPGNTAHINLEESVDIYPEELEVLKIVYIDGLTIDEAASMLGFSNATLWRILDSARRKLVDALINLKPIRISLSTSKPSMEE
ncbi:MAG: DUF134 domain-containing protein [Infirmifilum uzonense]|uniref:DUF134 domain-containing protein n=1 Tax=Infirmifilum uzonense TaxID=1550241 RepID=UPI003C73A18F